MPDLCEQKSRIAARRKHLETKKKAVTSQQKRLGPPEITFVMLDCDASARYRRAIAKANFATKEKPANLLKNFVTLYPKKTMVDGNIPIIEKGALIPSGVRPAHIIFSGISCTRVE